MKKKFTAYTSDFAQNILNTLRESLLVLDADLRIIKANASFYKTFQTLLKDTEGKFIFDLGNQQWNIPKLRKLLEEVLPESNAFDDYEVAHSFPKIGQRIMLLNARRILKQNRKTEMILLAIEDITKRKKLEHALHTSQATLRYTSYHDALTGLYNRAYYEEEMSRLGKDLARSKPLSIISIDIDGLKRVNDTHGHKAGDDLLVSTAKIISTAFRKIDILSRIGGDEFCVILPVTDNLTAKMKKYEIIKLIDQYNLTNPVSKLQMSIGVATSGNLRTENIYHIYQRADKNMYKYKTVHRDS